MILLAVNFHYIRETAPALGIYPRSLSQLEHQLERIAKHYSFLSQTDLREMLQRDQFPDGTFCVLTFDDGLAEQMMAFDLLQRKAIPAIFYPSSNAIRDKQVHDVHKLHEIFAGTPETELVELLSANTGFATYAFSDTVLNNEYRYDSANMKRVKYYLNFVLSANE